MSQFTFSLEGRVAGIREGQKLAREQRILSEAADLFASRGYAATGIEQIAGETGPRPVWIMPGVEEQTIESLG